MRTRALSTKLFVIVLSASFAAGAMQLFDRRPAHAGLAAVVAVGGLLLVRVAMVVRRRWRRLRSWPRPGEPEVFAAGPRRVLLADTGLVVRRRPPWTPR
jgi:hypothetical protein